jgi:hypothetical protein
MLVGCCSTRPQVRHSAHVVFPVDFDGGEHVYRVHPINIQLVTDSVIMPAKEEPGYYFGTSSIAMLKDVIKVSLLQKGQNNRIRNIVSVCYGIQCSFNNFKIRTNSSLDHNTSSSNTVGLVHTLFRKSFPTPAVHMITSIA